MTGGSETVLCCHGDCCWCGERDCLVCLCLFNNAVVISIGLIKECVFKISLTLF